MPQSGEIRTSEVTAEASWSAAQRSAIQAEADGILAHLSFRNSKRCVTLLHYLIDHALEGDSDAVKERTLGVEVFGRKAEYDTNADPIVRMTANEIRKRLAQYYQDSTARHDLHIRLVPGTYLPQFDFDALLEPLAAVQAETPEAVLRPILYSEPLLPTVEPAPVGAERSGRLKWVVSIGTAILVAALAGYTFHSTVFHSTQEHLWAPILESNEPATIAVGKDRSRDSVELHANWAEEIARIIATHQRPTSVTPAGGKPDVSFVDADVAARMTGWMAARHKPSSIRREDLLSLNDLRRGPVILIGAFNNGWNLVLLSDMRFRVRVDPVTKDEWVEDAQNPSRRDWKGSGNLLYSDSSTDYAIVTRVLDPDTGTWILAAGGLGLHGTEAAGDLLTDPAFANLLPAALRSTTKNFQIVIKTTVIDGHIGPPQIIASYIW